jgi:hypothetical protein
MKKAMKYILMTLISLEIALICLFFPSELSKWKDKQMIGSINLDEIEETKIEHNQQMTMLEKLELFANMKNTSDTIIISQGKYLKVEEIRKVCKREISQLKDMGIIQDFNFEFDTDTITTELNFYISTEEPTKSMIVWTAMISNDNGALVINLDDETGKILSFMQKGSNNRDIIVNTDITADTENFIHKLSEYYGVNIVSYELTDELLYKSAMYNGKYWADNGVHLNIIVEEKNKQFKCSVHIYPNQYYFGFDYSTEDYQKINGQ